MGHPNNQQYPQRQNHPAAKTSKSMDLGMKTHNHNTDHIPLRQKSRALESGKQVVYHNRNPLSDHKRNRVPPSSTKAPQRHIYRYQLRMTLLTRPLPPLSTFRRLEGYFSAPQREVFARFQLHFIRVEYWLLRWPTRLIFLPLKADWFSLQTSGSVALCCHLLSNSQTFSPLFISLSLFLLFSIFPLQILGPMIELVLLPFFNSFGKM